MRRVSFIVIALMVLSSCFVSVRGPSGYCSTVQADDATSETPRITATEPAGLVSGRNVTFKVRGFKLKEATELRFAGAEAIKVDIKETKAAGQPKGLDNKLVGDTMVLAEVTLPAELPTGLLEYVIATPAGEATGKIMVLDANLVIDEKEPNDGFRQAQALRPGQIALGSIQQDKDVDVYALTTQAGEQIKVTVTSGGHLMMDAALYCYDTRGQFLAAADDDQSRDPVLTFKPTADGTIFLCISSAHDLGGEWHSYLLTVEEVK